MAQLENYKVAQLEDHKVAHNRVVY